MQNDMTKRKKLRERLSNNPNDVTFSDIRKLLEQEGFTLDRITGSHHVFEKGETTFVVPVHDGKVKSVYVKRVIQLIEQAENQETEELSTMNYPIVIYPADEGGYVAEIPALKGCLAQGETLPGVLEELQTVTTLWIETAKKRGQALPDADLAIKKIKALSQ